MKKRYIFCSITAMLCVMNCSIKQAAFNSLSEAIAPSPGKAKPALKADEMNSPVIALSGESDIQLVSEVFPAVLKTYEMMHMSNPHHRGLSLMTGSLYVMYANAFVQTPADYIPDTQFEKKHTQYLRAKKFYRRGSNYAMTSLTAAYPVLKNLFTAPSEQYAEMLSVCKKADVESLFWAGSGILGAFALDPMDTGLLSIVSAAVAMLERAVALDSSFKEGGIWEVLTAFYAAVPDQMGGGSEKAMQAYQKAIEFSKGNRPSVYILYAQSFCVPAQDSDGFDKALDAALAIDMEKQPQNKLSIALSRQKAQWLKKHKEDFFL